MLETGVIGLTQSPPRIPLPGDPQTDAVGGFDQWWFAGGGQVSWAQFVGMVESRTEFLARADVRPIAARIKQEEV
jgi:hypothetical protein